MRASRAAGLVLLIMTGLILSFWHAGVPGASGSRDMYTGYGDSAKLRIVEEDQFRQEKGARSESLFSASDFRWKGGAAACVEETSTIYIPCDPSDLLDMEEEWTGVRETSTPEEKQESVDPVSRGWQQILSGLSTEKGGSFFCLLEEAELSAPAAAMREGHAYEALLITEKEAEPFRIVLTGLPALCIEKTDSDPILKKEDHSGRIRLIPLQKPGAGTTPAGGQDSAAESGSVETEPAGEEQQPAQAESRPLYCRFHVRGNVTASLPKKPLKISLLNAAGEEEKVSWLGMRTDDDWILNPLVTDATRVREKTAYALWEEIAAYADHPQKSSHLQYVELFFDNTYQGVYGLMEPVDGKQLGLERGDLLYKIDRWDREDPYLDLYDTAEEGQETEILNENGYTCVEIRYPKNWDGTASWDPMQAFHTFVFRTGDPRTLQEARLNTDTDSVVTLSLFCALTHAVDNNWKNSLLTASREPDGTYTLRRTIWDLNYVFGDVFQYLPEKGFTVHDPYSSCGYIPDGDSTYDFEAYLKADPSLKDDLAEKWRVWRQNGITAQKICRMAEENRSQLHDSGAMEREMAKWPQDQDSKEALEEMEDWIRQRFLFLDSYFGYRDGEN